MKISTKGRYALRVMLDIAQNSNGEFISLRDISQRQEVSMKYLEMIIGILNRGNFVQSQRGKDGGYRLAKSPADYTVLSILTLTEGDLAPISCLEDLAPECPRATDCLTLPFWQGLNKTLKNYMGSVTLEDILNKKTIEV
ncbi:MAG: RrF2 family transcriptional regulator [Spirochaetales bacterium]|nr:RrF2 family transcriptional regulator [Spirochaetales bacterium]